MRKGEARHVFEDRATLDKEFYEMAAKDYDYFMKTFTLATTPRQQQILAAQTCHGHAMNGDFEFSYPRANDTMHIRYLNCTISDIYDGIIKSFPAFSNSVTAVQHERMALIEELRGWVEETVNHLKKGAPHKRYNPDMLLEARDGGQPIMGLRILESTVLTNPALVLAGLYLGSYMDSPYWREQMEDFMTHRKSLPITMHRGLCTAGNLDKIIAEGMTVSDLAHMAGDSEVDLANRGIKKMTLKELKEKGLVVDFEKLGKKEQKKGIRNRYPYTPVYVEQNPGFGSSDDAAFIFAWLKYGMEAGLGLLLADAVDTIDKCVVYIKERGEDERLGDMIRDMFGGEDQVEQHLGVNGQDIINLIFAAAIDKQHPGSWPSCSQRRFLEKIPAGPAKGKYALVNHIGYINFVSEGARYPAVIRLGYGQISSEKFYTAFGDKMRLMHELGMIDPRDLRHPKNFEHFLKRR